MLLAALSQVLIFSRVTVGIVFGTSLVAKAASYSKFCRSLRAFGVPEQLTRLGAHAILLSELVVTVSMVVGGDWLRVGFALAAWSLVLFSLGIAHVLRRGIKTSCACFGPNDKPVSQVTLLRNSTLLLCVLAGLAISAAPRQISSHLPLDWFVASVAAIAFALICMNLSELIEILGREGLKT